MSALTNIGWCDRTFNPWWGCVEVPGRPECARCYAKAFARRTGHEIWGEDAPRRFFGEKHWREPELWNRKAAAAGERHRVFCASMADICERPRNPDVLAQMDAARAMLWALIARTPNLDWLLLTKRLDNLWACVPESWQREDGWPRNAWIGTTVGTQRAADTELPKLIKLYQAPVRFVSVEPLLDADLTLSCVASAKINTQGARIGLNPLARDAAHADWVIVGGESGPRHREMPMPAFHRVVDECRREGVALFVKQDSGPYPGKQGRIPDADWVKEFPTT